MPLWTKDVPPAWLKDSLGNKIAKQTDRGWVDPDTGEVIVSIGGLATLQGGANVLFVRFSETEYETGDPIRVDVGFSEPITVPAGATIVVSFDGDAGDITLNAAAHTNQSIIVFNKQGDNATQETLPVSVAADGTLTLTENAANGNTVTIGAKVYTFQDTLTNVDGNVDIGVSASATLDNLIAAINLGAGSGTAYAAATTLHPTVTAAAGTGDTMDLVAKTPGTAGNSIATTDTLAGSSAFGAVTLEGGVTNSGELSIAAQTLGGSATDYYDTVAAIGSLTLTANPLNTETVTVDGKVYTFQTTLTNVDGNVKIGANEEVSLENLIAAINLDSGSGTKYAAATTLHSTVSAEDGGSKILKATAKTGGTGGNSLATTTTVTGASWGAATLAGGSVQAASLVISGGIATAAGTADVVEAA